MLFKHVMYLFVSIVFVAVCKIALKFVDLIFWRQPILAVKELSL
jgi:hypothetical protein